MAKENKKDFNAMLNNSKDMPKIKELNKEDVIKRYGGSKMLLAPPIDYDDIMKRIPEGKITTSVEIRNHLAHRYKADFTCSLTAGIFISIAAWASSQRSENITPYWRTLKAGGELNEKYPGGVQAQKEQLQAEGHNFIEKGTKKRRVFVADYEKKLADL